MVDRTMSFMLLDPKQLAGYYKRLIGAWRIFGIFCSSVWNKVNNGSGLEAEVQARLRLPNFEKFRRGALGQRL